ncbi:chemotaxis protein CheW [Phaeovibrio sulfidiphilus]|uniref:Chemotaxis protein CheA n=1 Tax=Phaeovibrio sulfidiphilus TaxID=1220600 RepID=A0A8J6YLS4_9PROT|nr:chemotaxis protein CheW [Phaeovibrio sulfidiphilus]MBE1236740.1 chemotaxis protein CheW [Phaeovibrio sulfidiphilus]
MDDLLNEFLTETAENLATLDVDLVNLERSPNDRDILSNIFRLVHTIKGTCGFLGLPRLEALAHSGENVLGKFRDGELEVTPDAVTAILHMIDRIREILAHIEETESEPEGTDQDLKDILNAFASGLSPGVAPGAPASPAAPPPVASTPPAASTTPAAAPPVFSPAPAGLDLEPEPEHDTAPDGPVEADGGFPVAAELLAEVEMATAAGVRAATAEEIAAELALERAREQARDEAASAQAAAEAAALAAAEAEAAAAAFAAAAATPPPSAPAAPPAGDTPHAAPAEATGDRKGLPARTDKTVAPAGEGKETSVAAQSIRVSVDLLENLMTLVSELVLTRNQLLQMVRGADDSVFYGPLQRLSHITTDIQEGVMKTRMQPIGNAWAKLPRIVRDLAIETGKKIDLQMYGADTELDRQVLELIKDPLTHMVRNSADHGLEEPESRIAAGKPEVGVVKLNAYHEGGHIIIEISDDGRGLNLARIKDKAFQNGIASEAELDAMSDQQAAQLIFRAGLSTAEKVTSVSGRGVGMDVVRTNIEKIGGTIELKTFEGRGSTFTIKIPLTLAIVSALIVAAGGERFAIPQISVVELVRVTPDSSNTIERINNAPVLRLRDRLMPLVSLSTLLNLDAPGRNRPPAPAPSGTPGSEGARADAPAPAFGTGADPMTEETYIVVSQVGTYSFGIIVDRVFDTEEIVVKPVASLLRNITMFSGNTILGDGSVIMILDPNGIANAIGETSMGGASTAADAHAALGSSSEDKTSLLVFRAGSRELKAVPLALIARLEEIELSQIEYSGARPLVQYRGQLMPLVAISEATAIRSEGRQPVLVFNDRDRVMGLLVDEIVDIVEDRLKVELKADMRGIVGTAVVNDRATDIIDTGYYLTQAFGNWFEASAVDSLGNASRKRRVLILDDSVFFLNVMTPMLSAAGYEVTTTTSSQKALGLRDKGVMFDAVISDIEMPDMNGFEFAENVRKGGKWADIPLVALSGHATEHDLARARDAGFDDYVAKFDREALLEVLSQLMLCESPGAHEGESA